MLQIIIPEMEGFNQSTQEFFKTSKQVLKLEHSLISISKWESKYCKVFLDKHVDKTTEETIEYVRCMTLNRQSVDFDSYVYLTNQNLKEINDYIDSPMSATFFNRQAQPGGLTRGSREPVTSELIYYWMVAFNIPFECEKWHLNRLLNLIEICNIKNQSPKKRSQREILSQNAALNAARRKQLNTKG